MREDENINKVKCPECGHIQKQKELRKDSMSSLLTEGLFKIMNATRLVLIECEKCKLCYEQEKNQVENERG